MKCLILAGGRGERLWPLSRKNFPKQFIQVQRNHSLFQETVARNLPYCDEFVIITNWEYRDIVSNQMESFQGVPYRCIFEEEPRKTTAAITLACMGFQPSEYVFVVAADHVIGTEECEGSYKDSILKSKEFARAGKIVLFGKKTNEIDKRFGYLVDNQLFEKPDNESICKINNSNILQNIGLIVFQNGIYLNEIKNLQPEIYAQCEYAFRKRSFVAEGELYLSAVLESITPISIEKSILEKTSKLSCISIGFEWNDVGSLEDLELTNYEADGLGVIKDSENTVILNQAPHQAVVVNELDDVLVVNTSDAVYVGKRGKSYLLKEILHENPKLDSFSSKGLITYCSWGYYESLVDEKDLSVRRSTILPGKTVYEHKHSRRKENWIIIQGSARVTLNGLPKLYEKTDTIEINDGVTHQISNVSDIPLILVVTSVGDEICCDEFQSNVLNDRVTEAELGLHIDPIVKLSPVFKDYLWGGTKLRDFYGKKCDFDIIAESWELSAHSDGNCKISSGRHKGLSFSRYLETVGKEVLGWKCAPLQSFPLLVKFIDAKQNLSVQVHPYDDYALENENEYGKNEMWYVIDAEEGSGLYVGFNCDVDRGEVERRIADNTILDILNFFPTKPGDVFFIPAGTVHAIGSGNLICEIQQSSNVTYRLYDYDRCDKFGNQRELHLNKALDVLKYEKYESKDFEVKQDEKIKQIRCKYFETTIVEGSIKSQIEDDSFHAVVCIRGEGKISVNDKSELIRAGESFFIPATNGTFSTSGDMTLAIIKV